MIVCEYQTGRAQFQCARYDGPWINGSFIDRTAGDHLVTDQAISRVQE
jgi:hypothetical protein